MNEFRSEYESKDTKSLKEILGSLRGLNHSTTPARIDAVMAVLESREALGENDSEDVSYTKTVDEMVASRFMGKLKNARKRNLEFTLTLANMRKLVLRKKCYYTGMPMLDDVHAKHPAKRTLERLDSSKGYTPENTVACCHAANCLKNLVLECGSGELAMTKKQLVNMVGKL